METNNQGGQVTELLYDHSPVLSVYSKIKFAIGMKSMKKMGWAAIALMMTTAMIVGCTSSDNDEDDSIIMPVNMNDGPVAEFFKTELPEMHSSSDYYHQTESFFINPEFLDGVAIVEDIVCVINSREELADVYLGNKDLPEIDFDKYTLIIGQQIMPFLGFYVGKKELVADNNGFVFKLYARHDGKDDEVRATALQFLYFWAFYPKLSQKTITVNVIREYPNR